MVVGCALPYDPISIGDMIASSRFHLEDPSSMHLGPTHALGTKKKRKKGHDEVGRGLGKSCYDV